VVLLGIEFCGGNKDIIILAKSLTTAWKSHLGVEWMLDWCRANMIFLAF